MGHHRSLPPCLDSLGERMTTVRATSDRPQPAQDGQSAALVRETLQAIRSYLSERFPIVSQGGAVLSGYFCCYFLYGQAAGHQAFGWPIVVGAVSGVLLALVRRLVDDIEDFRGDVRSGRLSFADGGRRHLRGLVLAAVAITALVGLLNATCSLGLMMLSIGLAIWFPVATVTRNVIARSSRALFFVINESCPALGLLYPYAAWHEVSGHSLPAMAVVAIGGLFWTTYEFWNFTRKVGAEGWPPWGLTLRETRSVLVGFLMLAAGFSVLVAHYAKLPFGYLLYGLLASTVFATVLLRWWSKLPSEEPHRVGASWGGLPFAVTVEVGILIALLGS